MALSKLATKVRRSCYLALACLLSLLLTACAHDAKIDPSTVNNACQVFRQNPNWYWEALDTYKRWGVPVSVQMAIMQRESDFQAGAKPGHKKFLGLIPTWSRVSSAYGYAQALNGTWQQYQRETRNYDCSRNQFDDASDFIGWYSYKAHEQYGIRLNDAYHLYLAYHEGLVSYGRRTYLQKPWLLSIARDVEAHARAYRRQIHHCKYSIPRS